MVTILIGIQFSQLINQGSAWSEISSHGRAVALELHFIFLYVDVLASFKNVITFDTKCLKGLFRNSLICYFQIRSFASKAFRCYPTIPPAQPWEDLLSYNPNERGIISKSNDFILSLSNQSLSKIKKSHQAENYTMTSGTVLEIL